VPIVKKDFSHGTIGEILIGTKTSDEMLALPDYVMLMHSKLNQDIISRLCRRARNFAAYHAAQFSFSIKLLIVPRAA